MDTIFTRDSTLSPSETLQRASSVLSSIQHPVSFLPSAHFYAASSEQNLVGTAISISLIAKNVFGSCPLTALILSYPQKNFSSNY